MTPESDSMWSRWEEIDRIFDAALDRPVRERQSFVESECGNDAELRGAVLHLLETLESSESEPELTGSSLSQAFFDDLGSHARPTRKIDRYTIVRELGRGGMGTVYLAEHEGEDFRQQVALKVLRRGLDTDDILRRFVAERQILANLSHPNIARLYDGGTTPNGRPYLVMEYVEGEPITDYCDRQRLDLRQRLRLVLQVVDAVNAAHANLVVHRDLKPSNILVTGDGHPKLLDFGIAKMLDPEAGGTHTRTGSYLLTPDHASPEQLRGEPITTATDVYQLGVLIFRLLTGQRPFEVEQRSPQALRELAEQTVIRKPSSTVVTADEAEAISAARSATPAQLRKALRGDLDTIVIKSLNPDPSRRYSSAANLADDIRRYLDGRTITARPDTFGYQAKQFLRRNRWVAPVVVVSVLAIGFYIATLIRYTERLETERNTAQEVQQFLVDLFSSANPFVPADTQRGRRITVVEALDLGVERLAGALDDRPEARASILTAIAGVYRDLGVYNRALPLQEEALELERSLFGPTSPQVRDSLGSLAAIRAGLGEFDTATELFERRLELALATEPSDVAEVADARTRLGRHLFNLSRTVAAEEQLQTAVALAENGGVPPLIEVEAHRSLADTQRLRAKFEESERSALRAVELADQEFGAESTSSALARATLATTYSGMGRHEEADETFRIAIDDLERTLGSDHLYRLSVMANYAILKSTSGKEGEAAPIYAEIIEIGERVYGEDHPEVATLLHNYAGTLIAPGHIDEAIAVYKRAAQIYREKIADDNFLRALPLVSLAEIYLGRQQATDAEAALREAIQTLERALPDDHFVTAVAYCRLARALVQENRPAEAEPHFERSLAPILGATIYPDYRRTCLTAAGDYYRQRGDGERVARIETALESIDSDAQAVAALTTD